MLNSIVRDYYSSEKSIFNIYNTYMNHHSNNYIKILCESEINYIDQIKYEKIKKLYGVYDSYKLFSSIKYGSLCSSANSNAIAHNN